jgi:hypothetical protein
MLQALLKKIRVWHWKRRYRPGRVVTSFLAPDIRRDVEVVDISLIETGIISARLRTWNVLYAAKDIAPQPPFGDVRKIEIKDLWLWTGELWGGPVSDATDVLNTRRSH